MQILKKLTFVLGKSMLLVAALFITAPSVLNAQELTSKEKKIIRLVEKNHADALAFLERAVNINRGTMNQKGVQEVGKVFQEAFDQTRCIVNLPSDQVI